MLKLPIHTLSPSPQQFKLILLFNNYLYVLPNPTESQAGTFHNSILNLH